MLIEANSKPHDIMIYMDRSVTRDWSGWGFTVKQGGRTVHKDSGAHSHNLQSDYVGWSSHACNTMTSLPTWNKDYTCHHSYRLNEPPAKGGVWNGLPWLAHSHAVSSAAKTSVDLLPWQHVGIHNISKTGFFTFFPLGSPCCDLIYSCSECALIFLRTSATFHAVMSVPTQGRPSSQQDTHNYARLESAGMDLLLHGSLRLKPCYSC